MRILIDECLHTSLTQVARDAGHVCDHVAHIGLGGSKDWRLVRRIHDGDYVFVTNNRADFLALYGREELHPGLIIIVPNVAPVRQRELFALALNHIGARDLVNRVVEVQVIEGAAICREYRFPA